MDGESVKQLEKVKWHNNQLLGTLSSLKDFHPSGILRDKFITHILTDLSNNNGGGAI